MVAPVFVILIAILVAWRLYGPRTGFLAGFAKLLDHPEFVEGFANWVIKRSFLKGEFRGRNVVVLLQRGRGKYPRTLVVSMETAATATIESSNFVGNRFDKEGELAVFALEVKHDLELMLRVYMRSKMIKHNKDLFECVGDPMTLLEKLHIY